MSSITRKLKRKRQQMLRAPSYFLDKTGQVNQQKELERLYIQKMLLRQAQEKQIPQRQGR